MLSSPSATTELEKNLKKHLPQEVSFSNNKEKIATWQEKSLSSSAAQPGRQAWQSEK